MWRATSGADRTRPVGRAGPTAHPPNQARRPSRTRVWAGGVARRGVVGVRRGILDGRCDRRHRRAAATVEVGGHRGSRFDDRVSVVMITRNRVGETHRTLSVLEELPEHPRVIVVDNGSDDGTTPMVRQRHPEAYLIMRPTST